MDADLRRKIEALREALPLDLAYWEDRIAHTPDDIDALAGQVMRSLAASGWTLALLDEAPEPPESGLRAALTFLRKRLVGTPPNVDGEDAWMASLPDQAEAIGLATETPAAPGLALTGDTMSEDDFEVMDLAAVYADTQAPVSTNVWYAAFVDDLAGRGYSLARLGTTQATPERTEPE